MINFVEKDTWSEPEWDIFLNNLDLLRASRRLSKGELNKFVGRWNLFRKIRTRPKKETIDAICAKFGVDYTWLSTQHDGVKISDPEKPYDPHAGWKPRSIAEMAGMPEDASLSRAVGLLARIYESKNHHIIRAIFSTLEVFCERVDQEERIAALQADGDGLRGLVKNHIETSGYYGDDRRTGIDRRQKQSPDLPKTEDRRGGNDRRKPPLC